ncbi:hypothetical protein JOQ06_030065, partial [Pogonophryne albipinna]
LKANIQVSRCLTDNNQSQQYEFMEARSHLRPEKPLPSVKTVSSFRQEGSTGAVKRPPGRADRCSSTGALF